jgi:hypothetical protein
VHPLFIVNEYVFISQVRSKEECLLQGKIKQQSILGSYLNCGLMSILRDDHLQTILRQNELEDEDFSWAVVGVQRSDLEETGRDNNAKILD